MLIVREVVTVRVCSTALRLFNSQRSGRFVVAQQCVPHFALESGEIKALDVAELMAERLK